MPYVVFAMILSAPALMILCELDQPALEKNKNFFAAAAAGLLLASFVIVGTEPKTDNAIFLWLAMISGVGFCLTYLKARTAPAPERKSRQAKAPIRAKHRQRTLTYIQMSLSAAIGIAFGLAASVILASVIPVTDYEKKLISTLMTPALAAGAILFLMTSIRWIRWNTAALFLSLIFFTFFLVRD